MLESWTKLRILADPWHTLCWGVALHYSEDDLTVCLRANKCSQKCAFETFSGGVSVWLAIH